MKIKINKKLKKKEVWQLGDVIANKNYRHLALIVKDFNGNYVAMDIGEGIDDFRFSLEENNTWSDPCAYMADLQNSLGNWHKVNATLMINGDGENEDQD